MSIVLLTTRLNCVAPVSLHNSKELQNKTICMNFVQNPVLVTACDTSKFEGYYLILIEIDIPCTNNTKKQ